MPVDFSDLAGAVVDAFGESVSVSRTSGGTYSPAARGYVGATTVGPVTFSADVQAINQGASKNEDTDEFAINFDAADVAASALGDLRVDDIARVRNRTRRIVSVQLQAAGAIIRVVCRSEKRAA